MDDESFQEDEAVEALVPLFDGQQYKSNVWRHFSRRLEADPDPLLVCVHCKSKFSATTSTSTLHYHVNKSCTAAQAQGITVDNCALRILSAIRLRL